VTRLERWTGEQVMARIDELLGVYVEAMGYPSSVVASRRGFVAGHCERDAFSAVATLNEDDRVLGFGYGYLSAPGQWWHDQVGAGLAAKGDPRPREFWLSSAFELVELHVLPSHQGHGIGHAQLHAVLDGVPGRTVLLSTPEGDTRAWRLYRRTGFVDVLRHHPFPGDARPFAVLGRTLPLEAAGA